MKTPIHHLLERPTPTLFSLAAKIETGTNTGLNIPANKHLSNRYDDHGYRNEAIEDELSNFVVDVKCWARDLVARVETLRAYSRSDT